MFLAHRTTQAEYFDADRPAAELAGFFRALARLNRFFVFAKPFQQSLPKLLGESRCASLSILDLGAGDGLLGQLLSDWASQRGWQWRVTNLDLSLVALGLNPTGRNVAGSALALPFRSGSFDVVIASQMTHHLADAEVRQHLREAWRVSRQALVLCDLHRNPALYAMLWLTLRFQRFPEPFRSDGLLSVKRSWQLSELRKLAADAGIEGAQVSLYFGARVLLQARKPGKEREFEFAPVTARAAAASTFPRS